MLLARAARRSAVRHLCPSFGRWRKPNAAAGWPGQPVGRRLWARLLAATPCPYLPGDKLFKQRKRQAHGLAIKRPPPPQPLKWSARRAAHAVELPAKQEQPHIKPLSRPPASAHNAHPQMQQRLEVQRRQSTRHHTCRLLVRTGEHHIRLLDRKQAAQRLHRCRCCRDRTAGCLSGHTFGQGRRLGPTYGGVEPPRCLFQVVRLQWVRID